MNSKNLKTDDAWLPCNEGAILGAATAISDRENQKSRRQFLRAAATASVAVAGVGFTGWTLCGQNQLGALRNNANYPGGIACSEVKRWLDSYIKDSLNDVELAKSIEVHLSDCRHCCEVHDCMIEAGEVA